MSDSRGQRTVPKVNYLQLHSLGCTNDLESDSEDQEIQGKLINFKPINEPEILVEETPLHTPVDIENLRKNVDLDLDNSNLNDNISTVPETQTNMSDLQTELSETELQEKRDKLEQEQREVEQRAKCILEQTEIEAKERQLTIMRKQIDQLLQARAEASAQPPVPSLDALGDDPLAKQMSTVLEMLQKEAQEREKITEQQRQIEEKRKREEEERQKEEEMRKEEEECKKREEEEKQKHGQNKEDESEMDEIIKWVKEQKAAKAEEITAQAKVKELQKQIESMTKKDNRVPCHMTGVNMFAGLENLQGVGETLGQVDLAAKAQAAMIAATSAKRKLEEEGGRH